MNAKEYFEDCAFMGIPVPAFILGVMWFEGMIWITQQMLLAHTQLHGEVKPPRQDCHPTGANG